MPEQESPGPEQPFSLSNPPPKRRRGRPRQESNAPDVPILQRWRVIFRHSPARLKSVVVDAASAEEAWTHAAQRNREVLSAQPRVLEVWENYVRQGRMPETVIIAESQWQADQERIRLERQVGQQGVNLQALEESILRRLQASGHGK